MDHPLKFPTRGFPLFPLTYFEMTNRDCVGVILVHHYYLLLHRHSSHINDYVRFHKQLRNGLVEDYADSVGVGLDRELVGVVSRLRMPEVNDDFGSIVPVVGD